MWKNLDRSGKVFHLAAPVLFKSYFISFLHDLVSSSSVEQGAIWQRLAMVWMLAI